MGAPTDETAIRSLSALVDVITFDHELVDLDVIEKLEHEGVNIFPSSSSLRFAVDKAYQRQTLHAAGIPIPRFFILESWDDNAFDEAVRTLGVPVVKAARGGYDGRGVVVTDDLEEARVSAQRMCVNGKVVLEERLPLRSEAAGVVATNTHAERVYWPIVTTVQSNGMCTEVRYPAELGPGELSQAEDITQRVAELVNAVGILAIELFVTPAGVLVNEVATRPHNSGHWTIEGAQTSQFENHLRGVLGLALGATTPTDAFAVMVNVVGSEDAGSLQAARAVTGAHVHDYGKTWRPGRKLGHVTVTGDDATTVRVRAWQSANALKTSAVKENE
jgi:5-(carboxyamino)imidazole ribonucleotide synthase